MNLATLEDFAAVRGVQFDPTDRAARLALDGASQAVRSYTRQFLEAVEDDTVILNGTGVDSLLLPELPVTELGDIVQIASDGTEITLDPDADYRLEPDTGILWHRCTWLAGNQNFRVIYSHGRDPIPADIQMVVMQAAARRLTLGSDGRVVTAETIGSTSFTYETGGSAGGLLEIEREVLAPYRISR